MLIKYSSDENTPKKKNIVPIIAGAVAAFLVLLAIIAVIVWAMKNRNDESSEYSAVEMAEETVVAAALPSSTPITNDNPLWTTSITKDEDDPFAEDFEEAAATSFFRIADKLAIYDEDI